VIGGLLLASAYLREHHALLRRVVHAGPHVLCRIRDHLGVDLRLRLGGWRMRSALDRPERL
jgi:hypothetical protein